jgi:diguanylate cyclase (GGDEF)-like protein
VDFFTDLNDRYGHKTGDDCLRAVAAGVRASDFVARYGGEELAVILPGADTAGAEHVRAAVQGLRLPHANNTKHEGKSGGNVGAVAHKKKAGCSRMSPNVAEELRATGEGWQTRA